MPLVTQLLWHKDTRGDHCHVLHGPELGQPQAPSHQLQRMLIHALWGTATSPEELSVGGPGKPNPSRPSAWQQSQANPLNQLHTKAEGKPGSWAPAQGALHVQASHESLFPAS